jgi:general L-amino acid transport system substrate-binding protein
MRRHALLFVFLVFLFFGAAMLAASCGSRDASGPRLARIRQRGFLVCGVFPGVAGFAQVDRNGRYSGFDIDICRAVAAAVAGSADKIRYEPAATLDVLRKSSDIDLVSRRLTWSLRREGMGVLFGPVTFYDGQSFLVDGRLRVESAAGLAGLPICVVDQSEHDVSLVAYFRKQRMSLVRVPVADGAAAGRALAAGQCGAFSADVSELASVRSAMPDARALRLLPDRITNEPLAQLVRREDVDLFDVLRWTVFAMITAEELGVTSANVGEMAKSENPEIGRLLGTVAGNGAALGLDEAWARRVIAEVGNYAEVFERNLGPSTPIRLARGPNALWSSGGLLVAPPLK